VGSESVVFRSVAIFAEFSVLVSFGQGQLVFLSVASVDVLDGRTGECWAPPHRSPRGIPSSQPSETRL